MLYEYKAIEGKGKCYMSTRVNSKGKCYMSTIVNSKGKCYMSTRLESKGKGLLSESHVGNTGNNDIFAPPFWEFQKPFSSSRI